MWPTFQEKKTEGVGKDAFLFIDHLSGNTSGLICDLFGTCELH